MTYRVEVTSEGKGWKRYGQNWLTFRGAETQTPIRHAKHDRRVVCNDCEDVVSGDQHTCEPKPEANPRHPTPEEMAVLKRFEFDSIALHPSENDSTELRPRFDIGWAEIGRSQHRGITFVDIVRRTECAMMQQAAEALPDYSERYETKLTDVRCWQCRECPCDGTGACVVACACGGSVTRPCPEHRSQLADDDFATDERMLKIERAEAAEVALHRETNCFQNGKGSG